MNFNYNFSDKFGSYQLSLENSVICAVVTGAIGKTISLHYNRDFRLLMSFLHHTQWGYYGDFSQCEALTPEARALSVELQDAANTNGCVISAFRMNSRLVKTQMEGIRKDIDASSDITSIIFDTKDECINFIESYLAKLISKNTR